MGGWSLLSGIVTDIVAGQKRFVKSFFEKTEKIFEKTVYLKNIPSLVPTGRGRLGTVILKKGKKICPPEVAGKQILLFYSLNIGEKTFNST